MHVGGVDYFETFVRSLTKRGGVLSPSQYVDYGTKRSGTARREWRVRVYGADILGMADTTVTSGMMVPQMPPQPNLWASKSGG